MYVVYNKDYVHHLINESKIVIFAYNSDRRMYNLFLFFII